MTRLVCMARSHSQRRPLRLFIGAASLFLTFATICQAQQTGQTAPSAQTLPTLTEIRRGFTTHLLTRKRTMDPIPKPPSGFELVHYAAPLGDFPAYIATVSSPAADGSAKHPAIVWIVGGFDNSIGDTPWRPAKASNDQSARAFAQAGIVTMYPSLRGGNNNPGYQENGYGEVDDVIAAARYLASRPDVDPKRIYLGGHSTGGTLALLVAESNAQFRAVFAFGPVASMASYGQDNLSFDANDREELYRRAPILYLHCITRPTLVMEGTDGNTKSLHLMATHNPNPLIHFYDLPEQTHFTELAPFTPLLARAILADTGPEARFDFSAYAKVMVPIRP